MPSSRNIKNDIVSFVKRGNRKTWAAQRIKKVETQFIKTTPDYKISLNISWIIGKPGV